MKKIIFLTANGFEDEELIYPIIRLKEAGYEPIIATPNGLPAVGRLGYPASRLVEFYASQSDIAYLQPADYDGVIIAGGFEAPDRVRRIPQALSLIKTLHDEGKMVAAICHGPQVLISAGILDGRRATCHPAIAIDLLNAGALYEDARP